MSYFFAGILRIILLEASVALLVLDRVIAPAATALRNRLRIAVFAVAACSVLAFCNFGELHGDNGLVHPWEQYHFFIGAKYLHEVGYFDLYTATLVADREDKHALDGVTTTRDLHDFSPQPIERALRDGDRVRARFSPERWSEFKADWARLSSWPAPWPDVVADHGNSGSPAWALVAWPFVNLFGCSSTGQWLLALLDVVLMAVMAAFLARTFGAQAGAIGLVIWCLSPFCFDYLGGSILRWDWLFALGMALGFYKRDKPLVAGAFLGYAIVSKLFPLAFAVGLGWKLAVDCVRKRAIDPVLVRLAAGAVASAVAFVLVSSLVFGGFSIWSEYRERIGVAQHEKYYPNQYSLETVYLQFAASTPRYIASNLLRPSEIRRANPHVDIADHRIGFTLLQLALTALVLWLLLRLDPLDGFAVAPFLIFIWLTVNAYYWNMWGLSALIFAVRQTRTQRLSGPLIALHVMWASYYLYQHLTLQFAEGYFVALMVLVAFVTWVVAAFRTSLVTSRPSTPGSPAP